MAYTYDLSMFQETFESEFTWLNGFMRNVRRFGYRPAAIFPPFRLSSGGDLSG